MIIVAKTIVKEIGAACRDAMPQEACGVLFGEAAGSGSFRISGWQAMPNCAPNPQREFRFPPAEWIALCYGKKPVAGIYHSHPTGAAYPSRSDLATLWHLPTYWIISLADSLAPEVKAYHIDAQSRCSEQKLIWANQTIDSTQRLI